MKQTGGVTSLLSAGILLLAICPTPAVSESLEGLGFLAPNQFTGAAGVSADGSVVVGDSFGSGPSEAFRWVDGTLAGIGFLYSGPDRFSLARAVNADGSVVVGSSNNGTTQEAFRWVDDATGGTMTGLGFLYEGAGTFSDATGVSADGSVVVGLSSNGLVREAFRWVDDDGGGTITGLGSLITGGYSAAAGVSADGAVVVGTAYNGSGDEAFRWVKDDSGGTMSGLGALAPDSGSVATAVNADGSVVVGYSYDLVTRIQTAFRWVDDETDGTMTALGLLVPGRSSVANAVNADGTVVVGSANDDVNSQAVRWVASDPAGVVTIASLLSDAGVSLGGWQLTSATGVSASGDTVVGYGAGLDGHQQGWIARVGPEAGLITPEDALDSLKTLGAIPAAASGFLFEFMETNSEYARQHAGTPGAPIVLPLAYAEDEAVSISASLAPPVSPFRIFGYGIGAFAPDRDEHGGTGVIGASISLTDSLVLGGSFGYGGIRRDLDFDGETTIDGPAGAAFLSLAPWSGIQFLAVGTVAGLNADIDRGYRNGDDLAFSSGATDGMGMGGLVRAGFAFPIGARMRIEPFAAYQAIHVSFDGYTEDGGPFPAEVAKLAETKTEARLGAEARRLLGADTWIWGSAAWAHRFDGSGAAVTAQLIDLFGVSGVAAGDASDWLEVTTGASLPVGSSARLTTSVTAEFLCDQSATISGRIGASVGF